MLQSPQPPPTEAILTALLNEITTIPDNFVLVLDDYHVIDAKPVDDALTFLLEHLPPQMHLVIATREDPQLPLARLRARGQLTELRAADLRFTPAEAAGFLNQVDGPQPLGGRYRRPGRPAPKAGLPACNWPRFRCRATRMFPASSGHSPATTATSWTIWSKRSCSVSPNAVRSFLLQTSILDRLEWPAVRCRHRPGRKASARLEALERGNFFVVPLDDKRHWYRYHHLFADVLYAHLLAEQPDQVATLHRRASAWYEQHGSAADAIRHALAAEDFERAADLVERACAGHAPGVDRRPRCWAGSRRSPTS